MTAMTNTIPNVPRELLADLLGNDHDKRIMAERNLLAMLANAPSPAGVDGLEVVGYLFQHEETGNVMSVDAQQVDWGFEANNPRLHRVCALADYDKAQAIIDGLRGEVGAQRVKTCTALKERNDAREERDAALVECERRQMQLAACGVVALANTIESAGEARQMHPDYMSASCSDVADAVDREIALRTERDQQARRIGELEGLLRSCLPALSDGGCAALANRIDAALSAVCAAAPNIATTSEHSSQPERDPCPMCIKGGICNTPTCGRLLAMPKAY